MSAIRIHTGGLSFILNGSSITDFIEGDYIELNLVNALTDRLNGAGNSVTITDRVDGNVCSVVFRIVRYSKNDTLLSAAYNKASIEVFNGSMKESYHVDDEEALENWTLELGTFTTPPTHRKNNQTGEYTVEYTIEFRNAKRVI